MLGFPFLCSAWFLPCFLEGLFHPLPQRGVMAKTYTLVCKTKSYRWILKVPQGGPQSRNHADFLPFSRIYTINEKLGFSRKNAKIGRKTCLSRNHACFWMISRNHAHFSTFSRITHASRFTQSRRNKIVFTQSRRKIRPITQSRNPMGGLF